MIHAATLSELLHHFPALGELSGARRNALRDNAMPLRLSPGELAFEEGSACPAFVLLTHGSIKVFRPVPSGREIQLYRVLPGETCVLTLTCLIEDVHYPARGVAEEECRGAAVPRAFFLELLDQEASVRSLVFHSMSSRVVGLMSLVEEVAFQRLDQRLARCLLSRAQEAGSPRLSVTHQQLADQLGSVREIVSRLLGSFGDRGLIRLGRGTVELADRDGLGEIARGP